MRHPFHDHLAQTVRAARQGADATSLASEAIRMARIATAIHLCESARRAARPLPEDGREAER